MISKILTLALLVSSTAALGASRDHAQWSKRRAQKSTYSGGVYYWGNKIETTNGTLSDGDSKVDLSGTGVEVGTGIELDGWARLAGYGLYRNLSNGTDDTVFGPGAGLSFNLSFASPLVDLKFGAGTEISMLSRQTEGNTGKYTAQGGYAQVSLERFVASNISLELGYEAKHEGLTPKEKKDDQATVSLDTTSLWLGATFWMY